MADSIPSLRRKLDEALAEISRLKGQLADVPAPDVRTEYIYVDKPVPGPERIVYVDREIRIPAKPEIVEVERVVNVPVPFKVTERVIEYHDNPEHLRMIAELQGRLQAWQAISQSDS